MGPPSHEPSLTERLAERLARPVTDDDRDRARWHLLDWLGCALAGRASPTGKALAHAIDPVPAGPCWLAGFADRGATACDAAFLHGGLGSVHELDDLHRAAVVHPSDTVVPAALAVAQRQDATAGDLLDAIVRGHEAAIVVGRLTGPRHYRHWYSSATCGVFGAAAAAASLMRMPPRTTVDALGLAGMQACGPWQCREEAGLAKQFATAHAARSGVWAADMAVGGLAGPRYILEGPHGLLVATGAEPVGVAAHAFAAAITTTSTGPGPIGHWQIHEVSFKPWPACRHVHPAIEAALALRASLGLAGTVDAAAFGRLVSVEVEAYADALSFADRPQPGTEHEARFSLQHAVAVVLQRWDFTLADACAPVRDDPGVAAMRAKVRVRAAARFDDAYPARFGSAVTLVHGRDGGSTFGSGAGDTSGNAGSTAEVADAAIGATLTSLVETALGDPERPMSPAALRHKAATLLGAAGLPCDASQGLIEACLHLPHGQPDRREGLHRLASFWAALSRIPSPPPLGVRS